MKEVIWTALEAANATNGIVKNNWSATGVSIDTRTLKPGDIFVALKDKRDGHDFLEDAFRKGASSAMVSDLPLAFKDNGNLLVVPDVMEGLRGLAINARNRSQAKVIAITGSTGKTSTKEMLRFVLSRFGKVHASEKNFNNSLGVVLTLSNLPSNADYAIIEIGMSNRGEIKPLSIISQPHFAIITNIGEAHLGSLGTVNDIMREKSDIFKGLVAAGTAVIPRDFSKYEELIKCIPSKEFTKIRFGILGRPEYKITNLKVAGQVTCCEIQAPDEDKFYFRLNSPGKHNAFNAITALIVVDCLGLDRALALMELANWSPPKGRGSLSQISLGSSDVDGQLLLVNDCYNANPFSMRASLDMLSNMTFQNGQRSNFSIRRRVAILGDMLELGKDDVKFHEALAENRSIKDIDVFHCVGKLMRFFYNALPMRKRGVWFETSSELEHVIKKHVCSGDIIVVKGSNSVGLSSIVDKLTKLSEGHGQNVGKGI